MFTLHRMDDAGVTSDSGGEDHFTSIDARDDCDPNAQVRPAPLAYGMVLFLIFVHVHN